MKKILKMTLKIVCFFLVLSILLAILSYIVMPKNNLKEFGIQDVIANGILGEKDNTIDVLILGDSESYSAFTPMQMWRDYGFTSYICGTSSQQLYDTVKFLNQALEKQKPKVVIVETNTIYRKVGISNSIISFFSNYFTAFNYHDRWKSLSANDFTSTVEHTWTDDYKGFVLNTSTVPGGNDEHMVKTEKKRKIPAINLPYLSEIQSACEDNGAELLLVSSPSTKNWNFQNHNGIESYANENNIKYFDMNMDRKKLGVDWTCDTRDKGDHLNFNGAKKATKYLGDYLSSNYELPDHRNDKAFSRWNDSLKRYTEATKTK